MSEAGDRHVAMGQLIDDVARLVDPETVARVGDPALLATRYLDHQHVADLADIGAASLAAILDAHVRVAACRPSGTNCVVVDAPDSDDLWHLGGSTLLQVVTDDRPFLVDSVTMEITRQDWSIRHVFHPQLAVGRDDSGELREVVAGREALSESWMAFAVYPPLGVAAADAAGALADGVTDVLDEVRVVTSDWKAMRQELTHAVDLLGTTPYDRISDDRDSARELLRWLRDDNFTLLGYQEYVYSRGGYVPVADTALGLLREQGDPSTSSGIGGQAQGTRQAQGPGSTRCRRPPTPASSCSRRTPYGHGCTARATGTTWGCGCSTRTGRSSASGGSSGCCRPRRTRSR